MLYHAGPIEPVIFVRAYTIRKAHIIMSRAISRSRITKISALSLASIVSVAGLSIATHSQPEAHAASSLSSLSSSSSLPSLPLPHTPSIPSIPSKPTQPDKNKTTDAAKLNQIVAETNKLRAQHGLAPVKRDGNLDKVSQDWANHLAQIDELNHRPHFIAKYPSYLNRGGSENILQAWDKYSAHELVQIWYKSPGHRANMLSPQAKSLGVGIATRHDGKLYAVQNFAY